MEQARTTKWEARLKVGTRPWLASVGPTAVGGSAVLCIFFLVSDYWSSLALLVIPPTVLYLWVALTYWLAYRRVNQADKLATLAATTGIYLLCFPFYGLVPTGPQDRALGLLTLLAVMAGAFEIRRWRRRVSYLPLGGFLATVGISWLLRQWRGPSLLYLAPALLLHQALLLLVLCLPAELFQGGAGESPDTGNGN